MTGHDHPVEALLTAADPFEAARRRCFACGEENPHGLHMPVELDGERFEAQSRIVLDTHRQGWEGVAHGGIVSTLLDEVLCYSLCERRPIFTVELSLRYKKAVPLGAPLTVSARRTGVRGRLAWAEGEIRNEAGDLLVTAQAKFLRPRETAAPADDT